MVWKAVLLILLAVCDTSILVSHTEAAAAALGSCCPVIDANRVFSFEKKSCSVY
eukprot:COSAG01_NODE_119_length_25410_cov_1333.312275_10_plen_54_part_00